MRRRARTREEGFLYQSDLPNRTKDGQEHPVKGGHRSTGGKSLGGTPGKKVEVEVSHHQA